MSDTLASGSTLEATSQDGQSQRASDQQPQSEPSGQPSDKGQVAQDDNIRRLQSTYDKKLTQLSRDMQQRDQYIQQLTQQMREAQKNAAPDDYSKLEVELQWERQEKAQYAQRLAAYEQEQQAQRAKLEALGRIAERYGVTTDDLTKAEDYESAVELAIEARDKRKAKQQRDQDDKSARNMPDIGSGAPRTAEGEWERQYNDARQRKDTPAMVRLLRDREK
jgi:hypothetical protein